MTTFIEAPRVHTEPRSPTEHDDDCTHSGWAIQQQIIPGRLIAHCRGCTATRTVTTKPKGNNR
ncbi:MAG: hypothetical protein BGO26_16675 [Actinobacteria bacterium 69-20]|nr:hypothetical protein [Actinomycetota bacterium]OJV27107.1 MAG: hypothetical protein BGO26_16675 [Actinobacteria bacterium 69-20]